MCGCLTYGADPRGPTRPTVLSLNTQVPRSFTRLPLALGTGEKPVRVTLSAILHQRAEQLFAAHPLQ
jgi:hypothetical protein